MKYLWRFLTRSRAGSVSSSDSIMRGDGPSPVVVTTPGSVLSSSLSDQASRTLGAISSPSPLITQSIAPSAWARISRAVKLAEWPPTNTSVSGSSRRVSRARSTTSGILAR